MVFAALSYSTKNVDNSVDKYGENIATMCHLLKHNVLHKKYAFKFF
jgi:hypothetical protein